MEIGLKNRAWIIWLAKVRIIIVTLIFAIELAITRLTVTNVPVRGFVSVAVLWFIVALLQFLLLNIWKDQAIQARLQVLTDLVFTSAILYITGDVDTYFNFLFPLIILAASIQLSRRWGYVTAAISFILFGTIIELTHYGIWHSYSISPRADDRSLHIVVAMNLVAFFAVAFLAGNLSAKLRQVDAEALMDLQALHENIINSMSGGLITTDLRGRINFLNASGEKHLERTAADVQGKLVHLLFLDDIGEAPLVQEKSELRYLTPSGKEKTFGLRVSELRVPERGVLGYIYSFADLTEIRRLEREVQMRDRLSAVGRLAAGIAHEIRNPLSSIAGSVKVLSSISALNDEQRTLVNIVTRESERLNKIISDFLIYSREKKLKLNQENLVTLLEDTLTLLQNHPRMTARAQEGRITIVRNFHESVAMARVDGDKMKQVFWNLCENAFHALPEGGALTVSLFRENDKWVISFADNGAGIASAQLGKLFEPFQSQFEGGTGLGLAIVYQIVQAHQGAISASSAPGQGADFRVELPCAQASTGATSDNAAMASAVTHG